MDSKLTIYDIAKLAGVSPATVSRVIHQPENVKESTRTKVWNAFKELDITPADLAFKENSVQKKAVTKLPKVPTILVCIPGLENPFYNDVIDGIRSYLTSFGYQTIIYMINTNKFHIQEFLLFAKSVQAQGLITTLPFSTDTLYHLNAHYPLVQCSEYDPKCTNISYVSIDDFEVSKKAIQTLIESGCQKIGFFTAPYEHRYVQNRYLAYKSALTQARLPLRPDYMVQVSDFSYDRILAAAESFIMNNDLPDCIFAVSDKHAHAIIKAATKHHIRIPQDLKVLGFDDTMYATLSTPTISTIHQPCREIGSESARILLETLQNPQKPAECLLLPAKIHWREST